MKITIEIGGIDDKLYKQDIENKFQDFFGRVIADIKDNLNNDSPNICGQYELETAMLLRRAYQVANYENDGGAEDANS